MGYLTLIGFSKSLLFYVYISILDSLQIIGDYIVDTLYKQFNKD